MKTSPISVVALLLSVIACVVTFLKQPTESSREPDVAAGGLNATEVNALIQEAVDRRERALIRDIAPKIVVMTKELGTYDQLKPKDNPSSIEEMVAPFFKMVSTIDQ